MKKLSMILLAFLFLGLSNVVAQSENSSGTITDEIEVQEESSATKTAAESDATKSCKGKKIGGFNFNKTNNYSGSKSSCQGKAKRSRCCKGAKKKGCCSKKSSAEKETVNDTNTDDTNTDE
jgi:hypothetical protein